MRTELQWKLPCPALLFSVQMLSNQDQYLSPVQSYHHQFSDESCGIHLHNKWQGPSDMPKKKIKTQETLCIYQKGVFWDLVVFVTSFPFHCPQQCKILIRILPRQSPSPQLPPKNK